MLFRSKVILQFDMVCTMAVVRPCRDKTRFAVPSPPRFLLDRLKFLENHIIRLEKEYPPWAALHFNQPNRGVSMLIYTSHPLLMNVCNSGLHHLGRHPSLFQHICGYQLRIIHRSLLTLKLVHRQYKPVNQSLGNLALACIAL